MTVRCAVVFVHESIDFCIDLGAILDPKMIQNFLKIDPKIDHDSKTEKVLHDIHGTRSLLAPFGATVAQENNPEAIQDRSWRDFGRR